MPSTSTSETQAADTIVQIRDLDLVFQADVHRAWTWKEAFTRVSHDPAAFLSVQKDRVHVARKLNFDIGRGETVGLMGVNGAGKTSLCRCIAGMYRPTSGQVLVRG